MPNNNNWHSDITTQTIPGLSSVQAYALPPECWLLVTEPKISKAEIQVTLCVLLNYYQVGIEAGLMTVSQIVSATNLSKSAVIRSLNRAVERGFILKLPDGYEPRLKQVSKNSDTMSCHDMNHDSDNGVNLNKQYMTCHEAEMTPRRKICERLLQFGLAAHVAENIAMTNRYQLDLLERQLDYIDFELGADLLPKKRAAIPGYIVNRIKFDRIAPAGFKDPAEESVWIT